MQPPNNLQTVHAATKQLPDCTCSHQTTSRLYMQPPNNLQTVHAATKQLTDCTCSHQTTYTFY